MEMKCKCVKMLQGGGRCILALLFCVALSVSCNHKKDNKTDENKGTGQQQQQQQNQEQTSQEITITVAADENFTLDANPTFKVPKDSTWDSIKGKAKEKITENSGFSLKEWREKDKDGAIIKGDKVFASDDTVFAVSEKIVPPTGLYWKSVSCGLGSTYAIRSDGSLWVCGWNDDKQLGLGVTSNEKFPKFVRVGNETNWKCAAGGYASAFFMKNDGTLWACGEAAKGVQGTAATVANKEPKQIGTDSDWKILASSHINGRNGFAIKNNGEMWGWGNNEYKGVPNGTGKVVPTPIKIDDGTDWEQVSTGNSQALAIKKDGTLWGWGSNLDKALGGLSGAVVSKITQIGTDTDWQKVCAVTSRTYAIKKDGSLWGCGGNVGNIIGLNQDPIEEKVKTFKKIEGINGKVVDVSGDLNFTVIAVGEPDSIEGFYVWGFNIDGVFGDGNGKLWDGNTTTGFPHITTPMKVPVGTESTKYSMMAAGEAYVLVITKDGKMYGWGRNKGGQLGQDVDIDQLNTSIFKTPVEVPCPQN